MKITDYDVNIIKVNNEYLVAIPYEDTKVCRMSISPYDALPINDSVIANKIARKAGGTVVVFNQITGRTSIKQS